MTVYISVGHIGIAFRCQPPNGYINREKKNSIMHIETMYTYFGIAVVTTRYKQQQSMSNTSSTP